MSPARRPSTKSSPRRPAASSSTPNWWRRPLRAVHTVLREPDARDYDLPGVLDWLRRWRANVYAVNGGGLCAFYQTEVPFHRVNRYLDGRDLFKEIVDACHAEGIKVVARMDFRGAHRECFEAHPDWFARDAEGAPRMTGPLHAACPNSPYRNEAYAFRLVDEVLGRCDADGIWENAAAFGGRCYCPTCTRRFREEAGYAIPLKEDWNDAAWRRYVGWRYDCVREHTARLRDVVKAHGADKSYGGEFFTYLEGGARENAEDVDEIAEYWDYQMACIFPLTRGSYHSPLVPVPVWRAEEQMKYLRATGGGNGASREPNEATAQTPVMLYGHFDNQSRYTTPGREEMRLWLAGTAAQGGAPWDCSFVGVPPERWWDRRHQDVQEEFYGFMAEHEADFAGLESVAELGLVHSQRTQDRFASGDPARDGYVTHVRGWELALFAGHRQWDVVPPSQLRLEALRRYRAVVLPNIACLSDEEAQALREYVEGGGALLATFETGTYHGDGSPRSEGVLDEVLGVRSLPPAQSVPLAQTSGASGHPGAGGNPGLPSRDPLPYSYTRLRTRDALTAGFDETEVVTNEGYVRPVAAREGATVHATLVPEIVPQPPDLSYPTLWENDAPLVVSNRFGKGRVVYFAGQTDRLNVTSGHLDHQRLLANALAWALEGAAPVVTVEAERAEDGEEVHATLLRQRSSGNWYAHLVNYSGARGRPVRAPRVVGPVTVTLHLPGESPGRAELLVAGGTAEVKKSGGGVSVSVPRLELYEVVRLT